MGSVRKGTSNHRGILMSSQMIRAYQKGWKCMTRRTRGLDKINVRPDDWALEELTERGAVFVNKIDTAQKITVKPPYGWVGGFLYFKETWKMWERDEDGRDFLHFRADDAKVDPTWWTKEDWTSPDPKWHKKGVFEKWQPSLFMPQMCARFHDIPVTGVRVERLHEMISNPYDAIQEGVDRPLSPNPQSYGEIALFRFMELWDALNEKRGHGWKHNDWV